MVPTAPPDGLWAGLDAEVPVALVPVRLETRFGTRDVEVPGGPPVQVGVLRVRIYPDDISVLPSLAGLWTAERAAGKAFWAAQQRKVDESDEAFAHRSVAAWDVLVRQVGARRATFTAQQTRDDLDHAVPDRDDAAPSAHLLPDAWVVVGERDGATAFVHFVERAAADPRTGPSRDAGRDAFTPADALLVAPDDAMRWLTDFEAAVAIGMAAEIDLQTVQQAQAGDRPTVLTRGLSSLYVVGVRVPDADRTVEREAVELADLLTRHAALDRLALVAQGTPTNNLTDRPSGWSSSSDPYAGYHRLVDPAPAAAGVVDASVPVLHGGATDGAVLDAALGLDGVAVGLEGAERREQWLARNMALVTFPVTFGEVLGELGRHVLADEERYEKQLDEVLPWAREHVASYVRGRGPLPALRVGRNPYGVLPVMAPTGWVRQDRESPFTGTLRELLGTLRWYVERAARSVPRLTGGGRPQDELAAVLGLGPVPHEGGYRVRTVTGPVLGADMSAYHLANLTGSGSQVAQQAAQSATMVADVQMTAIRRLLSLSLADLVDGTQLERMSLHDVLPMRSWVAHTSGLGDGPADYLRRLLRFGLLRVIEDPPDDLLFLLAEHALAMAGELDAYRLLKLLDPVKAAAATRVPVEMAASATSLSLPRAAMTTESVSALAHDPAMVPAGVAGLHLAEVVADQGQRDALLGAFGHDAVTAKVNAYEGTARAVQVLADAGGTELDDEGYTRLTGEALACASTRLDAWYISLAMQRLATLRRRRPAGVQVGAWGVLVDVAPTPVTTADGPARWQAHLAERGLAAAAVTQPRHPVGFVQAPSMQQAVTAGILRSGELVHRGDGSTIASIDLTSRRTRTALDILEAMSHGQPLGALLGYRLERGLHAAGLHTAVATLRAAYPQRRVAGAPGQPAAGADAVVPAEVVDGLDVWLNRAAVVGQLGLPAGVAPLLEQLDEAVESVADLLVAEGVHQLASGQVEAAGGTFAAVAEGLQPPLVTVADEPRSGITITHRVLLAADPSAGTSGWDRTAPRARLAPEAELWAESVLGAAGDLRVEVGGAGGGVTVASLGLCALDLLAEAAPQPDGVPALAARLDAPPSLLELARAASDVLAAVRPAVPADLTPQQADDPTIGAAQVRAVGPPTPEQLEPVAEAVAVQVRALLTALTALDAATDGVAPDSPVDGDLLRPLARLGVPGAVQPDGPVSARVAAAASSSTRTLLRDVFRLVQQGQPTSAAPVAGPAPAPVVVDEDGWEAMLSAVTGSTTGIETLTKVTRRLGGDAVVPTLEASSALGGAVVDVPQPDVGQWLSRTSRVRASLASYDDLCLFLDAAGSPAPELTPCHLPATAGLAWLGGPLAEVAGPNEHRRWQRPTEPHSHVVVAGPAAVATAPTLRGWVLDEVAEVLPAPSVTTGLAVHYDAPGARAPQSILLAVHPDPGAAWSWRLLHATAAEAVALARLRGVDLDDLVATGIEEFLPLTYLRDGAPGTTPVKVLTDRSSWHVAAFAANRIAEVRF